MSWWVPTLEDAERWVREKEAREKLFRDALDRETKAKAAAAAKERRFWKSAKGKAIIKQREEDARIAKELLAQKEAQARRKAKVAAALMKAKQAMRERETIDCILRNAQRLVARFTENPHLDLQLDLDRELAAKDARDRRSRTTWTDIIDDKVVVENQVFWERRMTALAMHRAGMNRREISKRMGTTMATAGRMVRHAEMDLKIDRKSPAERYMEQQRFDCRKYNAATLTRIKPMLEPFMLQPSRDWLLVDSYGG